MRAIEGCAALPPSDFVDLSDPNLSRLAPRECKVVADSQPVFSWPQPSDRDTTKPWTLSIRAVGDVRETTVTVSVPRVLWKSRLPIGTYEWRVSYWSKLGVRNTSRLRQFAIEKTTNDPLVPDGAQIALTTLAKRHPRVLPRGSSFSEIAANAAAGEYAPAYAQMLTFAKDALGTSPQAEPALRTESSFASKSDYVAYLQQTKNVAYTERSKLQYLAFVWRLTGQGEYAEAAVQRLVNLAGWSPSGMTSQASQPQANREVFLALATGADLLWDQLDAGQRAAIAGALRARLTDVLASLSTLDFGPYQTLPLTAARYATQALLLSAGMPGFPESTDWLKQVWDIYVTTLSTFGGEDGGYDGSVSYAWFDMYDLPGTLAASRIIADADLTSLAYVRGVGTYLLAMTAPNIRLVNAFGDGVENDSQYANTTANAYRLYAALTRSPEHAWYWRQRQENYQNRQLIDPWHFMVLGLNPKPMTESAPTRNHWIFEDMGIAAFHSATDKADRSSIFFRSSSFGSYTHGHADQNSFVLVSRGKAMLVSGGYYPYYMSPHHAAVGRATRYKNAVTFDGGIGQSEPVAAPIKPGSPLLSMSTTGRLINSIESPTVSATTGDATAAYRGYDSAKRTWRPLLTNAIRSVAYFRSEQVTVIYDWLTSDAPRYWELNYNALKPFAVAGSGYVVENDGARVCIDHYGIDANGSLTTGFDVAPENGLPNQYQLRMRAKTASTTVVVVTVLREDCRILPIAVKFDGTAADVTVNADSAKFDKRAIAVLQR